MSKRHQALVALTMGMALSAQTSSADPYVEHLKSMAELGVGSMMESYSFTSPIFIPRKHPIQSYADHKRAKQKRKNRRASR